MGQHMLNSQWSADFRFAADIGIDLGMAVRGAFATLRRWVVNRMT